MRARPEVLDVVESPLVQIATAAERMPGSLKLCYGESDEPTPEFLCRALADAARGGHTFYTHTAGCPELREAIAEQIVALHGVAYRPSEIVATVGASMAIFLAIRALVGPGDNVVIVSPAYAIFANATILAGGEPRLVPLASSDGGYRLDLDRISHSVDERTRVVVVNSPSNPTGWVISADEQRALSDLAERRDLMILADEVYERLVFDRQVAPSFARVIGDRTRLVVVNSFSKAYNMTGWRLGWAQGSEPVMRLMYKAAEFITSNPATMVQQAGIVALREGEAYVADLRDRYARRREQVMQAFAGLPGISLPPPGGAFYVFPRIAGLEDSTRFTRELLEETGVALAPGVAFGAAGEGCVRLCFAASEGMLADALARCRAFLVGQV